jgi:hypothetical protein
MNDETCGNCRFWKDTGLRGDCHRYPPTPVYEQGIGTMTSAWPSTAEKGWCGEFQRNTRDHVADENSGEGEP